MLPVFINGVPMGNDMPQHFQFAVTVHDSLQVGDYYPAWMANENRGYGGIGMRFYPPLPYYTVALLKMATGNWFDGARIVFWLWLALSGVGAYFWARERFDHSASFIGAIIYIVAPYHLNEIYNAFTYGEYAAVAFLPFCFLFVDRLAREAKWLNFFGLAFFYALLILSNLPITVMGTMGLCAYCLASLPRKNFLPIWLRLGGGFLFGLALTAFYWIKVITEMSWLNHSAESYAAGSEQYDFKVNFLLLLKYVWNMKLDDRDMWFADLMLFATCCLFIPLFLVFWSSTRSLASKRLGRVVVLFLFALFMATPLSQPVWEHFTIIQKIQFPWRWLAIISVSGVPLAAAGWDHFLELLKSSRRPLALIIGGFVLYGVVFSFAQVIRQANYHIREDFETVVGTLADAPQNCDCWLPTWAKPQAMDKPERVAANGRKVSDLVWARKEKNFTVAAGEPSRVRLALFYYPLWHATINGAPAKVSPADDGALTFEAPAEESRVNIKFLESQPVRYMQILSLISWAVLLIFALVLSIGNPFKSSRFASTNT